MENEKLLLAAILVAAMFMLVKMIERRVKIKYDPESEESLGSASSRYPLKPTFQDSILAFISSLISFSLIEVMWPYMQKTVDGLVTGKMLDIGTPKVFPGSPDF
jgi:preprotein translocase subunit SecY